MCDMTYTKACGPQVRVPGGSALLPVGAEAREGSGGKTPRECLEREREAGSRAVGAEDARAAREKEKEKEKERSRPGRERRGEGERAGGGGGVNVRAELDEEGGKKRQRLHRVKDGHDMDASGLEESDITLVMDWQQISREAAIKALNANKNEDNRQGVAEFCDAIHTLPEDSDSGPVRGAMSGGARNDESERENDDGGQRRGWAEGEKSSGAPSWMAYTSDSGRKYYFNVDTNQSQWDPPPGMPSLCANSVTYRFLCTKHMPFQ